MCTMRASQAAPRRGGKLRVAAPANPTSLDPATGNSGFDHAILYPMFDTLVNWDYDTLKAAPGLASSWHSPDPRTLVLTLQAGVTFHDGTPFDANAVKFNLDRSRSDPRSSVKADLGSVSSVEVTSPLEVTIRLSAPDTALPLILGDRAGMMFSPKAAQDLGTETNNKPVGTGPWKFVSWAQDDRVVVSRNEHYWMQGVPDLDGIDFRFIPNTDIGLRSVVAGENDLVYNLSAKQKPALERAKELSSIFNSTVGFQLLYFNISRGVLKDMRVRQAINLAVDRGSLNQATLRGLGEVATSPFPKAHWAHDETLDGLWPHDPDRARKLLSEAGLATGVEVSVLGTSDQDTQQRLEVMIDQLQKVGITLKPQLGSNSDTTTWFFGDEKRADMLLAGWSGRPDPSLTLQLLFGKDAYYNAGRATPEGLSEALAATRSVEGEQRVAALRAAQKIIAEQALCAPLLFPPGVAAYSGKVMDFKPNLLGKPKFRETWIAA